MRSDCYELDSQSKIMTIGEFNEVLWDFYARNARDELPWRLPEPDGMFNPYKILVSEIMLQQTQVSRVLTKYQDWITTFPDVTTLANARLSDVIELWLGLGYNRRAKFLHECAKQIAALGAFPHDTKTLVSLPGIGINTAGAIQAYAFNDPVIFIETNIRTVFLYHFFANKEQVADSELLPFIKKAIDLENPREWYWALMDYGSFLKISAGNYAKNSKHHKKQSNFEGSKRQIRGKVLAALVSDSHQSQGQLAEKIADERLLEVLQDMEKEGLLTEKQGIISIAT